MKAFKNMYFCILLIFKANKVSFVVLTFLTMLTAVIPLISVYLAKVILDELAEMLFDSQYNIYTICLMIAGYAIVLCISSVITFWLKRRELIHLQNLQKYLNVSVMKKAVMLDVSSFDIPDKYESFRRGKNNVLDFQRIVFSTVQALCGLVTLVSSLIIAVRHNFLCVVVALLFIIPKTIWTRKKTAMEYEFQKENALEEKKKNYYFDILFNKKSAVELKYNNMDGVAFEKYRKTMKDLNDRRNRFSLKNNMISLLIKLPDQLVLVAVNIQVIMRIVVQNATIGDYNYLVGVFSTLLTSMNEISENMATYLSYDEKINEYKCFFEAEDEKKTGNVKLNKIDNICFRNVTFTYPGNETPALRNVSFEVKTGDKVYLVGFNGSGKSTIVKLLCGFYDPDDGDILINGLPMNEYDVKSLRNSISAVFQDYVTYSLSLRECVIFDDIVDQKRDEDILEALEKAEFKVGDIEGLSLDSYVNKEFHEDGFELSGGQKQKIAVGRAMYRKASLQLMDEPTASLDPEAESSILKRLLTEDAERINIVVSHCLADARFADKVIFLSNGQVVGAGVHNQLMDNVKEYRDFYEIQRGKYA